VCRADGEWAKRWRGWRRRFRRARRHLRRKLDHERAPKTRHRESFSESACASPEVASWGLRPPRKSDRLEPGVGEGMVGSLKSMRKKGPIKRELLGVG